MFFNKVKTYLPPNWEVNDISSFKMTKLDEDDATKYCLVQLMQGNFKKKIYDVYRIENSFLYSQYLIKKEEYKIRGHVNEMDLFHCTSQANTNSIVRENFNFRLVTRGKYGMGVSFSPSPLYANQQASLSIGLERVMIVAKVLVGTKIGGSENLLIPSKNCDTTTGGNINVYVKYYDNEFYPKYAIYYQSCDNPRPRPRSSYRWN